jgi:hypothetical protein
MVTVPGVLYLRGETLPEVKGQYDACNTVWILADSYTELKAYIVGKGGKIFLDHKSLLKELVS